MTSDRRVDFLISAACFGAVVTGGLGILVTILSIFTMNVFAAGASIFGTGVTFGLLAHALLRD